QVIPPCQRTMLFGYLRVVLQEIEQSQGDIANVGSNLLPPGPIRFGVSIILFGERKAERPRIHVHVGLSVRNFRNGKRPHYGIEGRRKRSDAFLSSAWRSQPAGFPVLDITQIPLSI